MGSLEVRLDVVASVMDRRNTIPHPHQGLFSASNTV